MAEIIKHIIATLSANKQKRKITDCIMKVCFVIWDLET